MRRTRILAFTALALAAAPCPARAADWLGSTILPSSGGGYAMSPSAAIAADGTGFVAWSQDQGEAPSGSETYGAFAAVRPPGGAWTALTLPLPMGANPGTSVGAASDGTATVLVPSSGGKLLQVITRSPNGAFGPVVTLGGGSFFVAAPTLAVAPSGRAIAAWYEQESAGGPYRLQTSDRVDGSWTPTIASGPTVANPQATFAAIAPTGRAVIVTAAAGQTSIALRGAGGGSPGTPTVIAGSQPATPAMNPAGTVAVAYRYTSGGALALRTAGAGEALGPEQSLDATGSGPSLDVGDDGSLHAAYVDAGTGRVAVATGTIAGGIGTARTLASPNGSTAQGTVIRADDTGAEALVWTAGSALIGTRRAAGATAFDAPKTAQLGPSTTFAGGFTADDGAGNLLLGVSQYVVDNSAAQARAVILDAGAPRLSATFPSGASQGTAAAFRASATDVFSTPRIDWDFGDGSLLSGGDVQHAYGFPGTFTAVARATDDAGNVASASAPVPVSGLPTPTPAPGSGAPAAAPPVDRDGDGAFPPADCNDGNPRIRPGAKEVVGNDVDENCDGRIAAFAATSVSPVLTWERLRSGRTRITSLTVSGVRRGDVVTLTCTGSGCRKPATRRLTLGKVTAGRISLTRYVRGTLRPKARLIVTVTRKDAIARRVRYTMISKKNPTRSTRCLRPGSKTERAC